MSVEYEPKQFQEVRTVHACPNIFLYGMIGSAIDAFRFILSPLYLRKNNFSLAFK